MLKRLVLNLSWARAVHLGKVFLKVFWHWNKDSIYLLCVFFRQWNQLCLRFLAFAWCYWLCVEFFCMVRVFLCRKGAIDLRNLKF